MSEPMAAIAWCSGSAFMARLVKARQQAGLTQKQAARLLNTTNVTISRYENGARRMSAFQVERFARIYDVDVNWLASGVSALSEDEKARIAKELSASKEGIERAIEILSSMGVSQGENHEGT